ncbi:DUF4136 domain-containing protein [Altererythrobacter sp. FM1]|uniref:DUF4136 domain-containing protein n=1 Tax=Tsuneonella flava TaxID=2055955 RepID=A0ABX7K8L7_9SPHN|nr:DUF4136 domain-containing protein [Tsuneonella flava]QSB44618.1 DUF4136 domain-containing protein [Tsuneonella flava]ROT93822.1 DUF4136 domain-containing protein [Altererythrobacter sp. FM1]UBS33053.1 DUF4136 domain-containing protein [Altererythrobacter sp. N1]
MNTPNKWSRRIKLLAAPLALGVLGACATPFNADVSRFQTQLPAPEGQTFAIVTSDADLKGGLEFSMYANQVAAQMEKLGYARASSPDAATLLVDFDYGVDDGRQRVRRTGFSDPFYDPWYGYGRFGYSRFYRPYPSRYWGGPWSYGFYDPFFDNGLDVYTVYKSGIELKISRASDGERLFEGRAEALSTSNRLQYLVPNLIEAMFTDFPGDSGKTVRISVAPENMPAKRR